MIKSSPRTRSILIAAFGGFAVIGSAAQAQLATETDSFDDPGGITGGAQYQPHFTIAAGDLLSGLTPTASTGNFVKEAGGGGLPVLTDGVVGTITSGNTVNAGGQPHLGEADNSNSVTYTLSSTVTLNSIVTVGGWGDDGRNQQAYTVSYELASNPGTFVPINTVSYNPPSSKVEANSTQVTLTLNTPVANVAGLEFTFANGKNGFQGYDELEAFGTAAVPEPSTWIAAGGLVLLAAGDFRRRLRG